MKNSKTYPAFLVIYNINASKEIGDYTNYWETKMADQGYMSASTHAGCVRLLVPDCQSNQIPDMVKRAKHVVISVLRGVNENSVGPVVSFTIEDGSNTPWNVTSSLGCFDMLPSESSKRRPWTFAIWGRKNGTIHKFMERPAFVRYVDTLPCLRPYDPVID